MHILEKMNDKSFWQRVREEECYAYFRDEAVKLWEKHCEVPIYALKYSEFKMFFTSGERVTYQGSYFTRRLAMDASAILALIYPEDEKYLIRLMDEIYAICDEYTWSLPAHQGQIEYNDNAHIDLFAAETAFTLAEIYAILSDRLDPLIKSRIEAEIERRVFSSFEGNEPYGHWETCNNNWNAVCTGSVACAYMLMAPERAEKLIPRFERAMDIYLSGFEDDGICTEGCGYWKYGFGFFTIYADMIRTFTKGRIDRFKSEKVRIIATYLQKMLLSGKSGVGFADAAGVITYQMGLQHYLKHEYPDDVLVYPREHAYIHDACGRFGLALRSATWLVEEYLEHPDPVGTSMEYYADLSQWFIKKTPEYGFAAKGGHNLEHHNHNDVGSFIFAKDGAHVLTDPGAATYSRQYFVNETRYDYIEASSAGHSLPIIGTAQQKFGKKYASRDARAADGGFALDIAGAYGIPELASLYRRFDFDEDSVRLTDSIAYSGSEQITERFVTLVRPEVAEDGAVIIGSSRLLASPAIIPTVTETVIKTSVPFFLIDYKLPHGTDEFTLEIK